MSFPKDFLKQLEQYDELSQREEQVFLGIFACGKTRTEVTEALHISESNLSTCLSGIYKKFCISGRGPVKESRLREYLNQRYTGWKSPVDLIAEQTEKTIDILVQEIREQTKPLIKERCGTMRVLDMEQPIELNGEKGIYTQVNILDKISDRRRLTISELLQTSDLEEFDRFGLNTASEERVPGIEAVERYSKLMVLGKPGAGKTTFLKYLAMQCIEGNFLESYLPVFITLKDFAEAEGKPDLLTYICQITNLETGTSLQNDVVPVKKIIQQGRALILLDGLDEVREKDTKRVLRQIHDFSNRFYSNQFVITCRIAAKEYTFERFTEVEVADFDKKQISIFAQNWFRAKNDLVKAQRFIDKLEENEPIFELATNPLLLTLLCLVFGESFDFPANRSELYKEGLDVLLKKWDAKRNIQRDVVYKNLSLRRKEDLLSRIALKTFANKDYFFKRNVIEGYIADFIYNLPDARTKPEELEFDSEAVLKSIQSQHGLLIERAKGIYSFSHLTFQEYFTAREIVEKQNNSSLHNLIENITDKRWREVFLLTVGMLGNADELFMLMKRKIDEWMAEDETLQKFLIAINQKSLSMKTSCKSSTIRIFYLYYLFDRHLAISLAKAFEKSNITSLLYEHDLCSSVVNILDCALERIYTFERILNNRKIYNIDIDLILKVNFDIIIDFYLEIDKTLNIDFNEEQKQIIQNLRYKLPEIEKYKTEFKSWWRNNSVIWIEQFKSVMNQHRQILSYSWQFTDNQKQLLQEYRDANELLIDCLNSDCYISRKVRQEIEDTLLLPMSEIRKRSK